MTVVLEYGIVKIDKRLILRNKTSGSVNQFVRYDPSMNQ